MEKRPPIVIERLDHYFGRGALRSQVLFDISAEVRPGEIVIATGPSGSGKTTLLTLIGALRTVQAGSVQLWGIELCGARANVLKLARRQIGYIFQSHNLLEALTARQNVELALRVRGGLSRKEVRSKCTAALEAVGLGDKAEARPRELSGGQRQRVAIARAVVARPRVLLADEPTASLDKDTGRDVVDMIQRLARGQSVSVLLVTHDNRILDIADRIIHLEDGRLSSFADAVARNTRHLMTLLAQAQRKGELIRLVAELPMDEFAELLGQVTGEAERFLSVSEESRHEAFESMLEQALEAFTYKLGREIGAERASIFLVDQDAKELWLKVAQEERGKPVDVRIPMSTGIAGHVASTGETVRVDDAYADPRFNPDVDRRTGFRTRTILCVPIRSGQGRVFGVAQLLNRSDGQPFGDEDEQRFAEFMGPIGVILETWWRMSRTAHQ
jgi:putative ABC transport system ATP-binding protein